MLTYITCKFLFSVLTLAFGFSCKWYTQMAYVTDNNPRQHVDRGVQYAMRLANKLKNRARVFKTNFSPCLIEKKFQEAIVITFLW